MSPQFSDSFARVIAGMPAISNRNVSDYAMGVKDARAMVARLESADTLTALQEIEAIMTGNRDSVRAELNIMAARKADNPVYHAQCCLVFALISPNMPIDQNIELTQRVMAALPTLETLADVEAVMVITRKDGKESKFNGWVTKAKTIHAALPFIQHVTPADMTRDNLLAMHGMGPKASAMAMALWDETANVFTLDVWMFRLNQAVLGEDVAVKFAAKTPAYVILERFWVEWAKTLDASVFEVQWTLWNVVGFGEHVSHLPIFGYAA